MICREWTLDASIDRSIVFMSMILRSTTWPGRASAQFVEPFHWYRRAIFLCDKCFGPRYLRQMAMRLPAPSPLRQVASLLPHNARQNVTRFGSRSSGSIITSSPPQLRISNSFTKCLQDFEPSGRAITWYTCGPTVYDSAHLGHARTYVAMDILRRLTSALTQRPVIFAMNITDIDDKIINRSRERNVSPRVLAGIFEAEFQEDMHVLGVLSPTVTPRVSDHIDDIVGYIRRIMERGLAYVAQDGSVYMDTAALGPHYGKLAPKLSEQQAALEVADSVKERGKRSLRDFALWKRVDGADTGTAAAGRLAMETWDSPWGRGRPGWHIECSAMCNAVFGDKLDIHAGGIDLAFPHHCNECAQADGHAGLEAVTTGGYSWTNTWIHTGHLHIQGAKMSKSLKNFITIRQMLDNERSKVAPGVSVADAFRMYCLQHRYASNLTWSDTSLIDASNVVRRVDTVMGDLTRALSAQQRPGDASNSTASTSRWGDGEKQLAHRISDSSWLATEACANDFDTPTALSHLTDAASAMQQYLTTTGHKPNTNLAAWAAREILSHFDTCGFGFAQPRLQAILAAESGHRFRPANDVSSTTLQSDAEVQTLLDFRTTVRTATAALGKELKKIQKAVDSSDVVAPARSQLSTIMTACDDVRDVQLPKLGYQLKDTPTGPSLTNLGNAAAAAAAVR